MITLGKDLYVFYNKKIKNTITSTTRICISTISPINRYLVRLNIKITQNHYHNTPDSTLYGKRINNLSIGSCIIIIK